MKPTHVLFACLSVAMLFACTKAEDATTTPSAGNDATPTPVPVFSTGQAASVVVGQADMTTGSSSFSMSRFTNPTHVHVSSGGKLFVSDFTFSRVVQFTTIPTTNGASGNLTIGTQGTDANDLHNQGGISSDDTYLYVADTSNWRLQAIPLPSADYPNASYAYGQSAPNVANSPSVSSTTMGPKNVFVVTSPSKKVIVADAIYHRVLVFNGTISSNQPAANLVLGQVDMNNGASGTTNKMNSPDGIWSDGTRLVVAEGNNHRVRIWNTFPTTDNQAPDIILGQPNGTTAIYNCDYGTIAANCLYQPKGVTSDGTSLFVSDSGNNRVLVWKTWPTTNQQAADMVFGQPDFATATAGTTATTMDSPNGLSYYNEMLFVADTGNNRVLIFKKQ